jgi:hypothetical protein
MIMNIKTFDDFMQSKVTKRNWKGHVSAFNNEIANLTKLPP